MSSIVGPAGCVKFNSSFLYYIGFIVICVISYMWGMRNGKKTEAKSEPKAAPKAAPKKATPKKATPKKAPPKKAPVTEDE